MGSSELDQFKVLYMDGALFVVRSTTIVIERNVCITFNGIYFWL